MAMFGDEFSEKRGRKAFSIPKFVLPMLDLKTGLLSMKFEEEKIAMLFSENEGQRPFGSSPKILVAPHATYLKRRSAMKEPSSPSSSVELSRNCFFVI